MARVAMMERVKPHTRTARSTARIILWLSTLLLVGGGCVAILWQSLNLLLSGAHSWSNAPLPLAAAVVLAAVAGMLVRSIERLARSDA